MAYDQKIAAALSGTSTARLTHWRRSRVLMPEISTKRPILYSYRDLVALRAVAYLRTHRSLQKIRKALDTLREIGEIEHLSSYRLVKQGAKSIVLVKDDQAVDLVDRPGQTMTVVKLGDVLQSFPLNGDKEPVPALAHPRAHLSVEPGVRGGHPVVAGTRVPFELVASLVRDGVAPERVSEFYPSVTAAGARDALDFADYVDRVTGHAA